MFASTHPQEFPPAILSRLQRFDVRRLTVPEISGKLGRILEADGRDAEPEAVALVARLAAGGMRDAESILDQLLASTSGPVRAEAVRELLGLADADLVDGFVDALESGDVAAGIALLDRLEERGRDLRIFLDQVVDALRERLVAGMAGGAALDTGLAAPARRLASIDPTRLGAGGLRLQLELALFETAAVGGSTRSAQAPAAPRPAPAEPPAAIQESSPPVTRRRAPAAERQPSPEPAPTPDTAPSAAAPAPVIEPVSTAAPAMPAGQGDDLDRLRHGWLEVVTAISASPSLKPLILECRPVTVEGNVVTLGFPEEKPFMREAAERKRAPIEAQIATLLGHEVSVRCVVSNLDLLPPLPADADAAHILAEAHRIFGEDLAEVPEVS
jgi:DNA polymerase-3 subunit gamma/tau